MWRDYGALDIDRWAPYDVDSIAIHYRYFRFNDSLPDSLVIQVYEDDKIRTRLDPQWQSSASYATIDFDPKSRRGKTPSKEIVYVLENKDTVGKDNQGLLVLPVGIKDIDGNFAITCTYYPGVPANVGDTIDNYSNDFTVTNKVNTFIVYDYQDEGAPVFQGNYNHGLVVTRTVRYNINDNGWNGSYQPGTSWASSSGTYHFDVDFLITQTPTDASSKQPEINRVRLYPSPAVDRVTLDIDQIASAQVTLFDFSGKRVLEVVNPSQPVDVSNLDKGAYYFEVTTVNGPSLHKFMKI